MRKASILFIVGLLAVTGTMAALAYSSATVRNPAVLSIVASDEALLSVVPGEGTGNKDLAAKVREDGVVEFVFGRGKDGRDYGLQPGSKYTWDNFFALVNNSAETLEVQLEIDAPLREYITRIRDKDLPGIVFSRNQMGTDGFGASFIMDPGETHRFELDITLHLNTDPNPGQRATQPDLGVVSGMIKVHAKALNTAN
ncbi:MAG: hypothetical protein ACOX5Q_10380 [Bacillota bacterium]|jgi:hypothetical protein|nr:hypothetical protein [Candidatus Fermentithermobacillaceae bacterium]